MISYGNIYQSKQFSRKMNAFKNFRGDKILDLISVLCHNDIQLFELFHFCINLLDIPSRLELKLRLPNKL